MKFLKFRSNYFFILIFIFSIAFTLYLRGEEKTTKSEWKMEDVINQEYAGSFTISPDGAWVLWVKTAPDKKKDKVIGHIFLSSLGEKLETLQLTRCETSESRPKWSPSGKFISFLSSRKGTEKEDKSSGAQLWLMDKRGGEPWKITYLEFGIRSYEWIDDNEILILTRESRTLRENKKKEKKDTSYAVEDQEHMIPFRLFLFNIKKKKLTRLTENNDEITNFSLSHNKKWILTRNNQSVRFMVDRKIKPKYFLINLEDKSSTELFPDPKFKPRMFTWAMDDKGFYFSVTRTSDYVHGGPGADFLYYFDLETKTHMEVPLDWDWGLFFLGFQVREHGFIASLANGAQPKWRRYYKNGTSFTYKELEGKHYPNIYGLYLQEKGKKAIYRYSTASHPTQFFLALLEENILETKREVFEINTHFKNKTTAKTEIIKWIGALDEEIEGVLYYPHDYKKGKHYPLILMIHGGPTGVDMDAFRENWGS